MVKDKPDQTRTYDCDGYRRRAACICVRTDAEDEVLLVSSSSSPSKWVVPGGGVDPDEACEAAAVRECHEEAGVTGALGRCLGEFLNEERRHKTLVYVLRVERELDDWDDSKMIGRRRQWFSLADARQMLSHHKPIQMQYLLLLHNTTHTHNPTDTPRLPLVDDAKSNNQSEAVAAAAATAMADCCDSAAASAASGNCVANSVGSCAVVKQREKSAPNHLNQSESTKSSSQSPAAASAPTPPSSQSHDGEVKNSAGQ